MSAITTRMRGVRIAVLARVLTSWPMLPSVQTVALLTGLTVVTLEIDAIPRAGADAGVQRTSGRAV